MIIKRDEDTKVIELDTEKITTIIASAFYETFLSTVSELLKKFRETIWEFLKRNFVYLVERLHSSRKTGKLIFPLTPVLPILKISVLESHAKLLILAFEAAACRMRTACLQRTQNRGSDHSDDEIVISYAVTW